MLHKMVSELAVNMTCELNVACFVCLISVHIAWYASVSTPQETTQISTDKI